MQHSDNKLVQLTLEGDHDAFAVLVEKYQSKYKFPLPLSGGCLDCCFPIRE